LGEVIAKMHLSRSFSGIFSMNSAMKIKFVHKSPKWRQIKYRKTFCSSPSPRKLLSMHSLSIFFKIKKNKQKIK
jgi:hypothetical protein